MPDQEACRAMLVANFDPPQSLLSIILQGIIVNLVSNLKREHSEFCLMER